MNFLLSALSVIVLASPTAYSVVLAYDNAPFSEGSRRTTSLVDQGYTTSGRFGHSGTQNANRSSNESTGFLNVIDQSQIIVRLTSGGLFNAVAIDLAEYSTVFRHPAIIELFGEREDGAIVSTVFTTDGLFDGPGGIEDFQTFVFPGSFTNLSSLFSKINSSQDHPFSLDNLIVDAVPEPCSAVTIGCGAFVLVATRVRRRRFIAA